MTYDRCKPYQGAPLWYRSKGGKPRHEPNKRGLNTKIHLAVDAHGMPVRVAITKGTTHDSKQGMYLIERIDAEHILADKAYDSDEIVFEAISRGMGVVIPPKANRKKKRSFDRHLYRLRYLVENTFLHFKRWRGIATRYAKNTSSFLAAIQIKCIQLWGNLI